VLELLKLQREQEASVTEVLAVDFDDRRDAHVGTYDTSGSCDAIPVNPAVHPGVNLDRELASWQINDVISVEVVKALANERRLQILTWLKRPRAHFPPQVDGDLIRDGVCSVFIARKLKVSAPTASEHLRILTHVGLIRPKRIKQWSFYKRDEKRIAEIRRAFRSAI
jgi:DNA-binding transcriptional ArsR family regulator